MLEEFSFNIQSFFKEGVFTIVMLLSSSLEKVLLSTQMKVKVDSHDINPSVLHPRTSYWGVNISILGPSLILPLHLYADAFTVCRPLVSVPGEGLHPHRSDTTTETSKPKIGYSCSFSDPDPDPVLAPAPAPAPAPDPAPAFSPASTSP